MHQRMEQTVCRRTALRYAHALEQGNACCPQKGDAEHRHADNKCCNLCIRSLIHCLLVSVMMVWAVSTDR